MSTYEHSLMLRNQETTEDIEKKEANSVQTSKSLPPIQQKTEPLQPKIASINEVVAVKTNSRLDRTKNFLANEINYLELSTKSFGSNSNNKVHSLSSPQIKKASGAVDLEQTKAESCSRDTDSEDLEANPSNDLASERARILCMNTDPKNKYSKFNNDTKLGNSGEFKSESIFTQRHVPLFLPISTNLASENSDESQNDNCEVYVKRSTRRNKIVKLPMQYNDTSPEPSSKN